MAISNEERRWVVIGVCLTKVLAPALRNVLATEIPKWYHVLCQAPAEIDKQVYGPHKIQLNPSTLHLNYKNINNNHVIRSPRSFDYAVKDPLSLAKLFVQPFMSKFTGFDQTMDISAVLSVIGEAAPFTGAALHAKTVRSDIRNEWAHCNFAEWTDAKFKDAFQSMEALLKNVNLSPEDEQKLCDELNSWEDKGFQLCFGQPVDIELLTLLRSKMDELYEAIETWSLAKEKMTELRRSISNIQTNMKREIEDLRTRVDEVEMKAATNSLGLKRCKNQQAESNKKVKLLEKTLTTELSRYRIKEKEKIPYVFNPPMRNPYFTGRETLLEELKRVLKVKETLNEKKVRVAAVCGLGGIGKTSLVSEYAHQMKDFYEGGVYWFSAADDMLLDTAVNKNALEIDALLGSFDLTLSNIMKKISSLSDPTLIVLDCVDQQELSSNVVKFLSSTSQENIFGHFVIITRRNPELLVNDVSVNVIEEDSCLQLKCFQPQEAKEFLFSRADVNRDENVESVVESLCEELGRLPLALEQAGACIKMLRCNLSLYLEQYKDQRLRLLENQKARPVSPDDSRERLSVHTTWLINMEYMKKSANGPAAVRFMNASSFFNGNEIEKELINVGTPEVEDDEYRKCVSSPLGRHQILKLLTDFSLFTYVNAQSISAHCLVLELVEERLDPESKAESFIDAMRLLSCAFSKCSSPSNHVSLDESNDEEHNISLSDLPNSRSHFYMWSKFCMHGYHLCRNMENLLESVYSDSACFPETAKILYECAVYLSANHKQEEAKRTLNFGYRILDWLPLVGYETVVKDVSDNLLFPLPIPLPKLFQILIKQYCKPSFNSFEPLTLESAPEASGFASEANDLASEGNDVAPEVVEPALEASDLDSENNVEKLGSYKEALSVYSFASVDATSEQYEKALKAANDYITRRPDCWKGYAFKAVALDGLTRKSSPDLQDKVGAEIAAALAFYHKREIFSDFPAFEALFVGLKERICICDCVYELLNAIYSEAETGGRKILVLGSEEYCLDFGTVDEPWNNCVLVGTRKNCSVSLESDDDIDLLMCMLTNLSFCFNEGGLHCLPGSFVKTLNCNFTSNDDTKNIPAVETKGEFNAEQCDFTHSSDCGLTSTGSGKALVIDCSFSNNLGNGLEVEEGGKLIVRSSSLFTNGLHGLKIGRRASECIVDNCYIHHNGGNGMVIRDSKDVTLIGNNVFGNDDTGIIATGSEVVIRENNVFDNCEWGIWSKNDSSVNITMNRVSRNKAGGIRVGRGEKNVSPSVIQQNKIYDNIGPGFVEAPFFDGQPPKFQDNEMYNNKENGNVGKLNLSVPYCSNCRKRCELRKCEKCFTTAYCSKSCQDNHWSKHEKICKVLREKLSYLVTTWKTAEYLTETANVDRRKDVGPTFSPPPPRDGMFVAKVHTAVRETTSYSVILFDRSLEHYVKFDSKIIDQLLKEFGVLCENKVNEKKLFFHCLFEDNGQIRLFTNEFAEFQNW